MRRSFCAWIRACNFGRGLCQILASCEPRRRWGEGGGWLWVASSHLPIGLLLVLHLFFLGFHSGPSYPFPRARFIRRQASARPKCLLWGVPLLACHTIGKHSLLEDAIVMRGAYNTILSHPQGLLRRRGSCCGRIRHDNIGDILFDIMEGSKKNR